MSTADIRCERCGILGTSLQFYKGLCSQCQKEVYDFGHGLRK